MITIPCGINGATEAGVCVVSTCTCTCRIWDTISYLEDQTRKAYLKYCQHRHLHLPPPVSPLPLPPPPSPEPLLPPPLPPEPSLPPPPSSPKPPESPEPSPPPPLSPEPSPPPPPWPPPSSPATPPLDPPFNTSPPPSPAAPRISSTEAGATGCYGTGSVASNVATTSMAALLQRLPWDTARPPTSSFVIETI